MSKGMNWDEYDRGRTSGRHDSFSSNLSRVQFTEPSSAQESDALLSSNGQRAINGSDQELRRRRSSIAMAMGSLAQAGGANSLENFARSWQRAVAFQEFTPSRGSFQYADDEMDFGGRLTPDERHDLPHGRSLLRQQLSQEGPPPEQAIRDGSSPGVRPGYIREASSRENIPRKQSRPSVGDIFAHASNLAGSFSSSFSGTYGSLADRVNETSRAHVTRLFEEQQVTGEQEPDKETEPLLLRRVEEDGKVTVRVIGQSTIYQTVLNSTNVLIGVGLLSLPLAIRYAGWVAGLTFLVFSYMSTGYTAHLLGKCLTKHPGLITFVDLAYVSFGPNARIFIGVLFNLELTAAGVALFVLFADSLNILVDQMNILEFKLVCGLAMIPLSFVPFRWLGYTSLLGIICCLTIVILVTFNGLIKPEAPGSLIEPADTYLFPHSWMTLPLSFGLLMSPWGGHGVFPSIFRDMRHPEKYTKSLYVTFNFTFLVDSCMAVVGLLMFGDNVRDEVTSNVLATEGYPHAIYYVLLVCIGIIPLTKLPLNVRPIFSTFENMLGLGPREIPETPGMAGMSGLTRGLLRAAVRITVIGIITIIAIVVPSFDRVMALMGSAFCFTICIILPCSFYLRLFDDVSFREKALCWFLMLSCAAMGSTGTVWAFLPAETTGARSGYSGEVLVAAPYFRSFVVDLVDVFSGPGTHHQTSPQMRVYQDSSATTMSTVAYLGPPASYSHQDFPEADGWEHEACATIRDIFTTVNDGRAEYGVIPFENSTYGCVVDTVDLLAQSGSVHPTIRVVGEAFVAVHHTLLGRLPPSSLPPTSPPSSGPTGSTSGTATPTPSVPAPVTPRSSPLVPLDHVTRVFSHPQAIGQSAGFLAAWLPRAERQETASTSRAAVVVAAHEGGDWAAIASGAAAEVMGLDVLARDIEDRADNITRFLTVTGPKAPQKAPEFLKGDKRPCKSLVLFTVDHAEAGALAAALKAFEGLNLSSINSRPSGQAPWHYVFLVECAGRDGDNNLKHAMEHLDQAAQGSRLLGSFSVRNPAGP